MGDRRAAALSVAVAVVLSMVMGTNLALAQDPPADPAAGKPVDLGVYGAPVRFTAPDGITIELGSGRRLVDTVEFRPAPAGGMTVIAEMDLNEYVAGIGEMPVSWPIEALKAQAVAARTYALYQTGLGTYEDRGLGYDICATTACQVFRGRSVVETPKGGQRWQRAVDETAGEVLRYDGQPILARYFSTSGGRTRNNEDIFPSSGPFPYLKGVDDPDDAVSPLHRWNAVFTRAQFDDLLARGEQLAAAVPVETAKVIQKSGGVPDEVVVTARDGTTAQVTAGGLKRFLNTVAPQVYQGSFPGPRNDGKAALPSTVPSSRFSIEVTPEQVVLHGSGWGHGVGLGQYGAKGKAERGLTYRQILAAYYNGVEPTTSPDTPDRIRVGLADDLDSLSLSADGRMRVQVGDTVLTPRAFGTWRVRAAADATTRVVAPAGYGAPLVAEPTTTPRTHPFTTEAVPLETVVNKPAELVVDVRQDGAAVGRRRIGVIDAGRRRALWNVDTDKGPLAPGEYQVRLLAIDEAGTEAGKPVTITVADPVASRPAPSLLQQPGRATSPVTVVLVAAVAGGALGAFGGRRRSAAP